MLSSLSSSYLKHRLTFDPRLASDVCDDQELFSEQPPELMAVQP